MPNRVLMLDEIPREQTRSGQNTYEQPNIRKIALCVGNPFATLASMFVKVDMADVTL